MDLLADENQHRIVVERLRDAGHSVEWLAETSPGMEDVAVLARDDIRSLVLLTYDRDFGDLIFNRGLTAPRSIIYTRLSRAEPEHVADRLLATVAAGIAADHMITITKDGTRERPFPLGATNG